ncbi:hypothetical protein [Phenylobacterium sp.]|uniref:hypothetical protein n=1 Tax=Phenylobacterium sp. TaxID=1871053 RepID=UPI002F3EB6F3
MAALAVAFAAMFCVRPAAALPSFAQQTGEPCASCHVGAYGPQLKPYGRDFKLFGYVSGDGANTLPPIAALVTGSFTETQADRPALAHYATNDNSAVTSALLAYAGKVGWGIGTLSEVTYDPVRRKYAVSRVDFRRAFTSSFAGGKDLIWGAELNNRPGLQDLWNSTPVFEFNAATSAFAASPAAASLIDGKLSGRVAGAGFFAMWDDWLYTEFADYGQLDRNLLNRAGLATPATADRYQGQIPYWRLAAQHSFADTHYWEVGAYGLHADRFPGDIQTAGTDGLSDLGFDATYQYIGSKRHFVAAHATWIHEEDQLDAARITAKTAAADYLDTIRADVIYSFADTWTPAVEWFHTSGSTDPKFFKTANGSPNTDGYVVELSYAPFGKKSPSIPWANLRLNARYVGYTRFNGATARANANNTLFIGVNLAFAPFGGLVKR